MVSHIEIYSKLYNEDAYNEIFKNKEGSLEEAISKAINEKPDSSKDLKEDVNAKDLLEKAGKYLKYSDLLLQKGRLIQQGKPTAMIDREISKRNEETWYQRSNR